MDPVWGVAILGFTGALIAAALGAWIGGKYMSAIRRSEQDSDIERSLGRVEGRSADTHGRTTFDTNAIMILGQLSSDVANTKSDIAELRIEVASSRGDARRECTELNTRLSNIERRIEVMATQLETALQSLRRRGQS